MRARTRLTISRNNIATMCPHSSHVFPGLGRKLRAGFLKEWSALVRNSTPPSLWALFPTMELPTMEPEAKYTPPPDDPLLPQTILFARITFWP